MSAELITCDGCKKEIEPHKIVAIVPRNPADTSCSPHTDLVRYCGDCWPKHAERYQI